MDTKLHVLLSEYQGVWDRFLKTSFYYDHFFRIITVCMTCQQCKYMYESFNLCKMTNNTVQKIVSYHNIKPSNDKPCFFSHQE